MKLVVVRHGETEENNNDITQGQLQGRLTKKGKKQAQEVAQELASEKFDQVWSSDLARCVETAEEITTYHPENKLRLSKALRERALGEFEGKPWNDDNWDGLEGTQMSMKPDGGESNREVVGRITEFVNGLRAKSPDAKILLVTHGGPIRIINALVNGLPLGQEFKKSLPHTSVRRFEIIVPLNPNDIRW